MVKLFSKILVTVATCCFFTVSRLLQEQMEQSLSDMQRRLSVKMNELHVAHEQIEKLEERLGDCAAPATVAKLLDVFFVCVFDVAA